MGPKDQGGSGSASDAGTLAWVPRSQLLAHDLVEELAVLLPRVLSLPGGALPFFAHYGYDQHDQLLIRFDARHLPDTA